MQTPPDAQLLRDYAEHGADAAFTELVQRHTNLVYSAALRQVESPAIAAEIAQNVFISLAHGAQILAPRFAAEASLAGWLCRSARNLSLNHRRDEFRRATRERQAMEQLLTLPDPAPDWDKLRRVLDDAMSELAETDYDALVLRYFQDRDFHAVGAAIGVSDDTAQKRVARALDKLRDLLAQRGIRTTTGALGLTITANAVQAAPAGLAVTISAAALAGTAVTTSTLIATTKTIAMTTLQKIIVTAALTAAVGAGLYQAKKAHAARAEVQTLRQKQAPLEEQIQQLQSERDNVTNRLADLLAENSRLKSNPTQSELLKLRGEVTRLRPLQKDINDLQKVASQSASGLAEWQTSEVRNAGRATPQDAMQTYLWSATTTNLAVLSQCFVGDETDPVDIDGITSFTNDPILNPSGDLGTVRIISQKFLSAGEVLLDVQVKFEKESNGVHEDSGVTKEFSFRNVNGEWKLVLFNVRDANGRVVGLSPGIKPKTP